MENVTRGTLSTTRCTINYIEYCVEGCTELIPEIVANATDFPLLVAEACRIRMGISLEGNSQPLLRFIQNFVYEPFVPSIQNYDIYILSRGVGRGLGGGSKRP